MKFLPYALVKKADIAALKKQLSENKNEISGAAIFVKAIEQGNLEIRYNGDDHVDKDNTLASSLISMRDQMKKISAEEKERSWVSEGMAKFVEILRSKGDNREQLSDDIIRSLVKYMNANQGALYVVNDHDKNTTIEMVACYAYNRKKYLHKQILPGEGLVGQVVLEKESIYMTAIPDTYIHISSGLGDALPKQLLIVPLKIEDKVLGVVEIASFQEIKKYQIEFVEKLGESLASTISSVKVGENTRKLLMETQVQAEQLRSQEEEMRQNMEELSATQEEMQRVLFEVKKREAFMTSLIDSTNDSIITIDRDYKIISCNKTTYNTYKSYGIQVGPGTDIFDLLSEVQKPLYKKYYERTFAGEFFEVTEEFILPDRVQYFMVTYSPLRDEKGIVTGAAAFGRDVTTTIESKREVEALLRDSQQKTEELKAQEEELRQNMEELQSIQEELVRKNEEMESVRLIERDRADTQIKSQKKNTQNIMTKFKQLESQYKSRIAELETKVTQLEAKTIKQ